MVIKNKASRASIPYECEVKPQEKKPQSLRSSRRSISMRIRGRNLFLPTLFFGGRN